MVTCAAAVAVWDPHVTVHMTVQLICTIPGTHARVRGTLTCSANMYNPNFRSTGGSSQEKPLALAPGGGASVQS